MGWVVNPTPGHFTSGKESQYPLYRRLGGPQGRSGRVRKISFPPGFDSQTIQPVAGRFTDYGTLAQIKFRYVTNPLEMQQSSVICNKLKPH
jgi:hypothetical protein